VIIKPTGIKKILWHGHSLSFLKRIKLKRDNSLHTLIIRFAAEANQSEQTSPWNSPYCYNSLSTLVSLEKYDVCAKQLNKEVEVMLTHRIYLLIGRQAIE